MKRILSVALSVGAMLIMVTTDIHAVTEKYTTSGNACSAYTEIGRSKMEYSSYGPRNKSTTTRYEYVCPVSFVDKGVMNPGYVTVWYYDRNDTNSVEGLFSCVVNGLDQTDTLTTSTRQFSCSFPPYGCGGAESANTFSSAAMQYLYFDSGLPNIGWTSISIACRIPAEDGGAGSHLAGYYQYLVW